MAQGSKTFTFAICLRWLARGVFLGAALYLALVWWPRRKQEPPPAPEPPKSHPTEALREWTSVPWERWTDATYGVSLERPVSLQPDEVFEEFTEHPLDDLQVAVVAGFRASRPILVYRYRAPADLSTEAWLRRARTQKLLRREFGSEILSTEKRMVSGVPALDITARGAVSRGLWNMRSLFFGKGSVAFRVTVGAEHREYLAIAGQFQRVLDSVRYEPPGLTREKRASYNTPAGVPLRPSL